VWWEREKGYVKITFLDPARKRRRQLFLVVALLLVCLFALGYSHLGVRQERVRAVIQPTVQLERPPRPPATDDLGLLAQANVGAGGEKVSMAPESSSPSLKESCDDLRVLVDRSHPLPPDYVPEGLVSLWAYDIPTLGGGEMLLRRKAAEQLSSLVSDAAADGEELVVASAYRSYADQRASHARLASVYGAGADGMSATPGHSQHQLGTAVDFTNAAVGYQVWLPFGETTAYWWLEHHAQEYGFVLAYPRGKEEETGYQWEPWHYRYVGVENAQRLERSGLSLQELLEREGVMPRC
jgi:D-alanyl-D-alanine carboxypeptidase